MGRRCGSTLGHALWMLDTSASLKVNKLAMSLLVWSSLFIRLLLLEAPFLHFLLFLLLLLFSMNLLKALCAGFFELFVLLFLVSSSWMLFECANFTMDENSWTKELLPVDLLDLSEELLDWLWPMPSMSMSSLGLVKLFLQLLIIGYTRQVSSMIPAAEPTVPPVAISILTWKFCLWYFEQDRCHQWSTWPDYSHASSEHCILLFCLSRFEKWGRTTINSACGRTDTKCKKVVTIGRVRVGLVDQYNYVISSYLSFLLSLWLSLGVATAAIWPCSSCQADTILYPKWSFSKVFLLIVMYI